MGNAKYATGQFYPEIDYATIDDKAWLNRTILDNQDCLNCSVAFLCGGGCVYQALEKSNDPNKIICTKADLVLETFMTAIDQNISLVHEDTLYE